MKSLKSRTRKSALPRGRNAADLAVREQELRERVAQKAYDLYEKRGRTDGYNVEDWLEGERLLSEQVADQRSLEQKPGRDQTERLTREKSGKG